MPPEDLVGEALCNSGLWLDLHGTAVYYSTAEKQASFLSLIREALAKEAYGPALRGIARGTAAELKVDGLIAAGNAPRWKELVGKYLEALAAGIERELAKRNSIPVPGDAEERIRRTFSGLGFFDPGDVLEIPDPAGDPFYVNYISRKFSPRYDGHEGPWDRDTQFKMELLFGSGLFVWLSANVSAEFRGKRMGTELIGKCEAMAAGMGFRRFSVPGPNREFWGKMGYSVAPGQIVVIGPSHNPNLEAYKEIP